MKIFRRATAQFAQQAILHALAILFACALPLAAQTPSAQPPPAPTSVRAVLSLDGPYRFAIGDDPRWADPAFDDTSWLTVTASQPLVDQGIGAYSGYAWYRLRVTPQQLSDFTRLNTGAPLVLLVKGNSVGQLAVYLNGVEPGPP